MIRSLDVIDPTNTHIKWWETVDALKEPRKFTFKPGLNVLWGKNGSGKTTLIKALAQLTHCEQSGNPVVTQTSTRNLFDRWSFSDDAALKDFKTAVRLKHDGQGVRYFDPGNQVGLSAGSFDYDFTQMGIQNTMFKGSSGQTTMMRVDALIGAIIEGATPDIERRVDANRVNTVWQEQIQLAEHFLKGSGKKGSPTILLDEPTRSLDLPAQVRLWQLLRAYAPATQFIVASHSLFALGIPDANYIELSKGYLDTGARCRDLLSEWADFECKPIDPKIVAEHLAAQKAAKKK